MKKLLSLFLSLTLLFSVGCNQVSDETSMTVETTETTSASTEEETTAETTSFETTEPVIRPDLFPEDMWTYHFECDPLPENVDPEDIVLTLGGPPPYGLYNHQGELCYTSQHPRFEIKVKNNSSVPIDVYNIMFLEQYTSPGKKEDVEYYNGWRRVPYNYANYFADKPAKTTLLPGEETLLTFYHDIYMRYEPGVPDDLQGSFLNQFPVTAGDYRLAVYMDGGVRYMEFKYIIIRRL